MNRITKDNVRDAFTYQPVTGRDQQMAYDAVVEGCINLAGVILNVVPEGTLKDQALLALFNVRMIANAGIATANVPDHQHDVQIGVEAVTPDRPSGGYEKTFERTRPRPTPNAGIRPPAWVPPYQRA